MLPMLRGMLTMLQGTWFWGVGFILYNPLPGAQPWDPEDKRSLMLAVVCFSWHVAVHVVLAVLVGGVTACCHRRHRHRGHARPYSKLDQAELPLKRLVGGPGEEEEEEVEPLTGGGVGVGVGVRVFRDEEVGVGGAQNGGLLLVGGVGGGGGGDFDDDDNSDVEFQAPVRK